VLPGIQEDLGDQEDLVAAEPALKDQTHQQQETAQTDLAVAAVHLDTDLVAVEKEATD
jgi:hypothetical protein